MRSIGKFSDELYFLSGLQLSTAFTTEESRILEEYGLTMKGLQEGTLMPTSTAEHYFLAELDGEFSATSNLAKCWQKYSKKIARFELQAGRPRRNKRISRVIDDGYSDDEVLTLDLDDGGDIDDESELDI